MYLFCLAHDMGQVMKMGFEKVFGVFYKAILQKL